MSPVAWNVRLCFWDVLNEASFDVLDIFSDFVHCVADKEVEMGLPHRNRSSERGTSDGNKNMEALPSAWPQGERKVRIENPSAWPQGVGVGETKSCNGGCPMVSSPRRALEE